MKSITRRAPWEEPIDIDLTLGGVSSLAGWTATIFVWSPGKDANIVDGATIPIPDPDVFTARFDPGTHLAGLGAGRYHAFVRLTHPAADPIRVPEDQDLIITLLPSREG